MGSLSSQKIECLIKGTLDLQLEFLAAKILLTRLKVVVTINPDELNNAVNEFRKLLETNSHLPTVIKDITKLI